MNRRIFLTVGWMVAIGAAVAIQLIMKLAIAAKGEQILVESEIERNHGHN